MSVAYLGAKIFHEEVKAGGSVWVARSSHNSIYAVEIDHSGFSLPVWSNSERVAAFLRSARLVGPKYQPHALPVELFATTWLGDPGKAIVELQINPDGKSSRVLVMGPEEFLAAHAQP